MKPAVLGATGSVGRELRTQALAAGHEVTALVREQARPIEQSGFAWTIATGGDFMRMKPLVGR
jgi:putative NADH-flavin reductase